jgi:hypothetical protein
MMFSRTVSTPSVLSHSWETVKHHGDFISNASLLVLNTCVVAQKAFTQIPTVVGTWPQAVVALFGAVKAPLLVAVVEKSWVDLTRAVSVKDKEGVVYLVVKISCKVAELFLTIGNIAVSIARVGGETAFVVGYYYYTRPIFLASIVGSVALDLYRLATKGVLAGQVTALASQEEERVTALFDEMIAANSLAAVDVIRHLDPVSWNLLEKKLPVVTAVEEKRDVICAMGAYFQNAHRHAVASVAFRALGYLSQTLCGFYPDTLVEAFTNWTTSLLSTSKLFQKKISERSLQQVIISSS